MTGWQVLAVSPLGPALQALPDFARPTLLVFPADLTGESLAGAAAALTGAALLGRITTLSRSGDDLVATRASHGGRIAIEIRCRARLAVATANVLPDCDGQIDLGGPLGTEPDREGLSDQRIALESAPIVLGGGRGLDPDGFAVLERIAELIGGAVGASLPAIDLGLAPVSRQVGQSGKFVAPRLYLAAGLSGTTQHLAGISNATRLLAINSDANASIFRFAEAGTVGDAGILLPLLEQALTARLADVARHGPSIQRTHARECTEI